MFVHACMLNILTILFVFCLVIDAGMVAWNDGKERSGTICQKEKRKRQRKGKRKEGKERKKEKVTLTHTKQDIDYLCTHFHFTTYMSIIT